MKGNAFQQWLKEFCALVFTQSVQAFLLAIILSMVVLLLTSDSSTESVTTNQAAGVLAIIALASISKMEDLIKKLFGIGSSITDTSMKGGKGGLVGSLLALQMLRKPLDNIPKVATGATGLIKARKEKKLAELTRQNSINKINSRYNELHSGGESTTASGGGAGVGGSSGGAGAGESTGTSYGSNTGTGIGGNGPIDVRVTNADQINAGGGRNSKSDPIKDKHKLQDDLAKVEDEYNKKMAEIAKNRRASHRMIRSGVAETAGGVLGGAVGTTVGLGMGENPLKTGITGMGIGDSIGQGLVNGLGSINETRHEINDLNKSIKASKEKLAKEMRRMNAGDI